MKTLLMAAMMLGLASAAHGHEVWIERDGTGPARIYLGEPAQPLPPAGDPEFGNLKSPKLLPASTAPQVRKAGYIEVAAAAGDVRAWDDNVFTPWGAAGKQEAIVYYARAGRSETRAMMPLEITPSAANGDRFVVVRDGKPVANLAVTVISPDKWSKILLTDSAGAVVVPVRQTGRYLLSATQKDEGAAVIGSAPVAIVHRTATTTFMMP